MISRRVRGPDATVGPDLRREAQILRSVLDSVGDGVLAANEDGSFVLFNPAAEQMLGLRKGEGVASEWTGRLDLSIPDELTHPLVRAMLGGVIDGAEVCIHHRDTGAPIWLGLTARPLRGGVDERSRGGVVVFRDITERRRREHDVATQLAAIVEGSTDAIVGKTLEGVVTSWNRAAELLYGYAAADAIGREDSFLLPSDRLDEPGHIRQRLLAGESIAELETVRLRRDGAAVQVSLSISPIRDEHGRLTGLSTIARDIAGRKRAEQERERLIAELRDAVGRVRTLSGLIPICASCKKMRDDGGYWNQVETYLRERSSAEFTHGICPDCARSLYGLEPGGMADEDEPSGSPPPGAQSPR